jgi:integrase
VHNDMIPKNPCDGIKTPSARRKEIKPLSNETVAALVAAAAPRYRAMVLLAAGSGLRHGELVGLELKDLDLVKGEVHVRQQAVRLDAGDPYIGPPKTDASYRTMPLAKTVTEALSEHVRRFPPSASNWSTRPIRGSHGGAERSLCSPTATVGPSAVAADRECGRTR